MTAEKQTKANSPQRYTLSIHPKQAEEAMRVLGTFVQERAALIDPENMQVKTAVDAIRLINAFFLFKEDIQRLIKTPVEAAYDRLRFTVIPNLMDGEGIDSLVVAGVGRINLQDDVQVTVEDAEGLRDWLTANNLEDMIKPTVNAQTLAAFIRNRVKEGKDLPDEATLKVKPIVRAAITRAGVKK